MRVKFQISNFKFQIILIAGILLFFFLPTTNYQLPTAYAQPCSFQDTNPRVINGLITAPANISNKFSNSTGTCVIDQNATFVPFRIPAYDDLQSIYYDQSKIGGSQKILLTGNQVQSSLTGAIDLSNIPPAPSVSSTVSCIRSATYSSTEIAIAWTAAQVSKVEISDGTTTWSKNVSGYTTTAPEGFGFIGGVDTLYSVKIYNGSYSSPASFKIPSCPPPNAPTATPQISCIANASTYTGSKVKIEWNNPDITQVKITSGANSWTKNTPTSPVYAPADFTGFTSATAGTEYSVTLYDGYKYSSPATFNIPLCDPPVAPQTAINADATGLLPYNSTYCTNNPSYSASEITISWNAADSVSRVDISSNGFTTVYSKAVTVGSSSTLAPTDFKNGTTQLLAIPGTTYAVRLYNGQNSATTSTFIIPPCPTPAVPTGFAATCYGGTANFSWIPTNYATSYNIKVDNTANNWRDNCGNLYTGDRCLTNITANPYPDSTPSYAAGTYRFMIQAVNPNGSSNYSSWSPNFTCQ